MEQGARWTFKGKNVTGSVNMLLIKMFLILTGLSGFAQAGNGWVSSGGELFKDAHNPWWLQNTPSVKYCIDIDEASVSASKEMVNQVVERVIAYWKTQFLIANFPYPNHPNVGTQLFVKTGCENDVDLRIQFGFGTLSSDQITYLQKPEKFAAVTVRTAYDTVNLRGKGFIFVGSDIGSHQYDGGPNLIKKPWQHQGLLYLILLHEMGHLFGIPHMGEAPLFALTGHTLMAENLADHILSEKFFILYKDVQEYGAFFEPPQSKTICNLSELASAWFELVPGTDCVRFSQLNTTEIEVKSVSSKSGTNLFLGKITDLSDIQFNLTPAIWVHLPVEQKVFMNSSLKVIPGPSFLTVNFSGSYRGINKSSKPLRIQSASGYFRVDGILDSRIRSLISE